MYFDKVTSGFCFFHSPPLNQHSTKGSSLRSVGGHGGLSMYRKQQSLPFLSLLSSLLISFSSYSLTHYPPTNQLGGGSKSSMQSALRQALLQVWSVYLILCVRSESRKAACSPCTWWPSPLCPFGSCNHSQTGFLQTC